MIIRPLSLPGVHLIEAQPEHDERGFFVRLYSAAELAVHGIPELTAQLSLSHNVSTRTLRGLHFQRAPHGEVKLVRCLRGSMYDVVVDVRPESPTFRQWLAVTLSHDRMTALVIPEGFAHGFVTLEPDTDVLYQMSVPHVPAAAAGIRWNDPELGITWPIEPVVISDRDRGLPLISEVAL